MKHYILVFLQTLLLLAGFGSGFVQLLLRSTRFPRSTRDSSSLASVSSSYLDSLSSTIVSSSDDDTRPPAAHDGSSTQARNGANSKETLMNLEALFEKYGLSSSTSNTISQEAYESASDQVGPGIYGGSVLVDSNGNIVYGEEAEYEDHGRPGPKYDGKGYSLMTRAVQTGDPNLIQRILNDHPHLIEEISTGGGTPLHNCGMSRNGQYCVEVLINNGANVHAIDVYGYSALHRMASNDLEIGAEALVKMGGLDPNYKTPPDPDGSIIPTPIEIAQKQRNIKFLMCMQRLGHYD